MNRRSFLSLAAVPKLGGMKRGPFIHPADFPWGIDRSAALTQRHLHWPMRVESSTFFDLMPLHLALSAYMLRPCDRQAIAEARRQLRLMQAATVDPDLSVAWRDMHLFATILLNAPEWHPSPDISALFK
jgi:hypothetical protein